MRTAMIITLAMGPAMLLGGCYYPEPAYYPPAPAYYAPAPQAYVAPEVSFGFAIGGYDRGGGRYYDRGEYGRRDYDRRERRDFDGGGRGFDRGDRGDAPRGR